MLVAFALSARHLWQGAALRRALIPNVMKVFSPDPAFLKRVAVASSSSLPTRVTFGCHHVRPHRSSAYMLGSRELGHWASCELDLLCVLLILHKQYPLTRSARGIRANFDGCDFQALICLVHACAKRTVRSWGRRKRKGSIHGAKTKLTKVRRPAGPQPSLPSELNRP